MEPVANMIGGPQNLWAFMNTGWAVLFALRAIASVRLADVLGDDPLTVEELASASGTHAAVLRRVLNLLAAEGLIGLTSDGRFYHNDYSRLLRADHPFSLRAGCSIRTHKEAGLWLDEGLRTGETPYVLRFGKPLFEHMAESPQEAQVFGEFMSLTTALAENAIFRSHRFEPFTVAVDVGGSHGTLLKRLLTEYPDARGILFDLPFVAEQAAARWIGQPTAARMGAIGGSFFTAVPEGADLYLLKQILHDWTDEECVQILGNIRRAIVPGGRLAIIEQVLPEEVVPSPGFTMDVWMFIAAGGRERKVSEFRHLLETAGFVLDRITPTGSPMNVIEAVPAQGWKGTSSAA